MMLTEASNIQDSNKIRGCFERKALIHPVYHVVKEMAVDRLRQSIASAVCLLHLQGDPRKQLCKEASLKGQILKITLDT